MASGMARKHQRKIKQAGLCAIVLSAVLASSAGLGQGSAPAPQPPDAPAASPAPSDTPPSLPPVMPAPFSQDCQIGNEQIVEQSPLPNVAAALQKRKQIRILAIGSSSSLGRRSSRTGSGSGEQIRDILQRAIKGLDVVMINRGVSGELAAQAATRVKNEVALQEPDVVLWQVGTNDALAYVPLDELQATIVDNVRWLREHKIDVVLAGLQYVDRMAQDDHYKAVRELLRDIAAREKVMIVRRYEAQRLLLQVEGSGGGLAPDEFERNDAGYACLSQYMARAITLGIFGQSLRVHPMTNPPASRPQN
jgi:lysophospholipase L1-like esterase